MECSLKPVLSHLPSLVSTGAVQMLQSAPKSAQQQWCKGKHRKRREEAPPRVMVRPGTLQVCNARVQECRKPSSGRDLSTLPMVADLLLPPQKYTFPEYLFFFFKLEIPRLTHFPGILVKKPAEDFRRKCYCEKEDFPWQSRPHSPHGAVV